MFLHVCLILFTGGVSGQGGPPPRMRTSHSLTVCCSLLPGGGVVSAPGVSAPGGRPPSWAGRAPPGQGEPPREQTPLPPGSRPLQPPHPHHPPPPQRQPPGQGQTPPAAESPSPGSRRAGRTPPNCSIRSMSGRYASYWDAFLLVICFVRFQLKVFFNHLFKRWY